MRNPQAISIASFRLGRLPEAAESYRRALTFVGNDSERRFLERRLREVTAS